MGMASDITMVNLFEKGFFDIALKRMSKKNRGAGVDNICGVDLPGYWERNGRRIKKQLLRGEYVPKPAEKHLIPKPGKTEKRVLEIPCLIDRVIQMALYLLLDTFYNSIFRDESYAFRRGRGQKDAIFRCDEILGDGYDTTLDLDIKSFFDTVDHDHLMTILMRDINDRAVLATIKAFLRTKVIHGRHIYKKYVGLSQGSPLSPLLANIYLNEFDTFLADKGFKFIRYADDAIVFFKGYDAACSGRIIIEHFLEESCRLKVNRDKTRIVTFGNITFLGYTWYRDENGHIYMDLDSKRKGEMYTRMQSHINGKKPGSSEWWDLQGAFNRGWVDYFRYIDEERLGAFLDEAEEKQYRLICEKIFEDSWVRQEALYIAGLNESRKYTGLREWFDYISE
ncbi:MAG: reverse transcriptase/maturase family protein [Lachnospiraceae bacterium]|nr:reverse transcriptase/maturase family protein [Lachnospiraceae bacterium]